MQPKLLKFILDIESVLLEIELVKTKTLGVKRVRIPRLT